MTVSPPDYQELCRLIRLWAAELGLQRVGIASIEQPVAEARLHDWLARGWHGDMDYMARHGLKRSRPALLEPGTLRVISARLAYLPHPQAQAQAVLARPELGYVSRYALGRDYHKVLRARLQALARRIIAHSGGVHRVFCDSAPVLEKPLAQQAGLGWIGKHTNLIARDAGSWFFLGEIYTSLPLPVDAPVSGHCGSCRACLDACPTQAIIAPYQLDARRCISYLTIEWHGPIPVELRPLIGNRIYGCDDCQWACPWNRFAQLSGERDFQPRHGLEASRLLDLFSWTESEFLQRTEGSALRRLGYGRWLRNLAVALGNGPPEPAARAALQSRAAAADALLLEHIRWAETALAEKTVAGYVRQETNH